MDVVLVEEVAMAIVLLDFALLEGGEKRERPPARIVGLAGLRVGSSVLLRSRSASCFTFNIGGEADDNSIV